MSEAVLLSETDTRGVARVTLNRPDLHNAFDERMIEALTGELLRIGRDERTRILVLAASGKSFSAGADLNWMRRMAGYSNEQNLNDAAALATLLSTLDTLPKPVIGRIQGAAFGGGVGLASCCDIAIASDAASFCLSEVRLGLIPAVISPYVINALGTRQARRYIISGERFSALEALRFGLVHEVVAAERLDERISEMVEVLLANGPSAMAAAKDLVHSVARGPLDAAMIADTAERIAGIRASSEGREGVGAFLEKRRPAWTER
jgi:methylglutaconyl-CoA hydratase